MRVLDTVLRQLSRSERMRSLRQSATGQGDAVPSCDIKRIQGAALQLISDMEEKVAIPDRYLHATVCSGGEKGGGGLVMHCSCDFQCCSSGAWLYRALPGHTHPRCARQGKQQIMPMR